jgi:hypothetical protein
MSLVPFFTDGWLDEMRRPMNVFDQHFGMGMLRDDLSPHFLTPLRARLLAIVACRKLKMTRKVSE